MEGSLNILASAQGIGKTTFVMNMLPSICEKQGKKVLFVSLEMTFMALHAKLVSLLSGVPFSKMMYDMQTLTTDEWISINNARARAYGYHIYRMGEKQVSTIDIRAKLKALKDVDIVILDYLQLVKPIIKSTSMYEIITNISRELKMIAAEANIPFIVIASINRDYSDRGDYRPHISDIRGSGNIEYDADMVLLLHRDSAFREYNPSKDADEYAFNHSADITVAKNRFGEANLRIDLFFDGAKSIMRESHEESTRPYKARADTGA
jgi:replicative DNA helicase